MISRLTVLMIIMFALFANKPGYITRASIHSTDSTEYMRQAIQFMKQIRSSGFYELPDKEFIVNEKPANIDRDYAKNFLNDKDNFSSSEITQIEQTLKNQPIKKWTSKIIPSAIFIGDDTIQNIFNDRTREWRYYHKHIGQRIIRFLPSIFMRNYTYCIFYLDYACDNLCGQGEIRFYRKEKNEWMSFKSTGKWIS